MKSKMIKDFIIALLVSMMTVLMPIKGFLIIISLFVAFDTILGIYTNVTLYGKKIFRSNRLFNVVIKTFFYMSIIILAFLLDHFIMGKCFGIDHIISKICTLLVVFIELKSIDEKSIKLGNKSIWILLKEMINKGKDLKKDLGDLSNTDKKDEE